MNDLQKFMYWHLCLSKGIIPITGSHDKPIHHLFNDMSPEEAKTCKRKFRKLWRKITKNFSPFERFHLNEEPWRRKREVHKHISKLTGEKIKKRDFSV